MRPDLTSLQEIFQDIFEDDLLAISEETSSPDIPGWDSLMHVTLILAVEKAYGVRFTSTEVSGLRSVGDLLGLIDAATQR